LIRIYVHFAGNLNLLFSLRSHLFIIPPAEFDLEKVNFKNLKTSLWNLEIQFLKSKTYFF